MSFQPFVVALINILSYLIVKHTNPKIVKHVEVWTGAAADTSSDVMLED